jgi:hypothetical protein
MKTPDEVEREFDGFFRSIGFKRVSEVVGDSPDFENADYFDAERKMVVELKVLEKDYFKDGGIIDRFCALVPAPVSVNQDGTGIYTISMPSENREGRSDTFEEPIRRILKKANRQLKQTNARLLESEGLGFIVLVMNGFVSLDPPTVARMVSHLLDEGFSAISGYILYSVSPNPWCLSAMAPTVTTTEYVQWYDIADRVSPYFDTNEEE